MSKKNRKNRQNGNVALPKNETIALNAPEPKLNDFQKFVLAQYGDAAQEVYEQWKRDQEDIAEFENLRVQYVVKTAEENKKQLEETKKLEEQNKIKAAAEAKQKLLVKRNAERRENLLQLRACAVVFCVYVLPMGFALFSAAKAIQNGF